MEKVISGIILILMIFLVSALEHKKGNCKANFVFCPHTILAVVLALGVVFLL